MSKNVVERYENIFHHVKRLAHFQEQLGLVRGAMANPKGNFSVNVLMDNKDKPYRWSGYGSERDAWISLVSEELSLAVPILGAVETSLREKIRKEKIILEGLGVSDI